VSDFRFLDSSALEFGIDGCLFPSAPTWSRDDDRNMHKFAHGGQTKSVNG
jgi:hypothetical protein